MKDDECIDFGIDYEILDEFLNEVVVEITNQALYTLSRQQCDQFMEWFSDEFDDSLIELEEFF